jgi:hypothetical protein
MQNDDLKKQYDLIYENISRKLEQQIESLGSIDIKASILLATIGILTAGYFQLLSSKSFSFSDFRFFVIIEILFLFLAGFYSFKAFIQNRNEKWRNDPEPSKLVSTFVENRSRGYYWLKMDIIAWMVKANEKNTHLIETKYDAIRKAQYFLLVAIVIIIIHLSLSLFDIGKITILLK